MTPERIAHEWLKENAGDVLYSAYIDECRDQKIAPIIYERFLLIFFKHFGGMSA